MLLDVRPHSKLTGSSPVDIGTGIAPVVGALGEELADLSRVRVVCDWVQYRNNFREVVDVRPILSCRQPSNGTELHAPLDASDDDMEIAVDVRRSPQVALKELTRARLQERRNRHVFLEDWVPGQQSCIWDFNSLYWSALDLWETASGHSYEQALPGGQSEGCNREAARDLIRDLFALWESLESAAALPAELYVVELGVGNGHQAKVFLDEFRAMDRSHGRGYYRRLQYLMCDASQNVLDLARQTVAEHAEHVSSFPVDATRPCTSLGFLKGKVFLVYVSNVYDNLPTDEVAQFGARTYGLQYRAYLPAPEAEELAASIAASPQELSVLVHKLLRLGPSLLAEAAPAHFAGTDAAVDFWQRTWSLLRLAERYVPLGGLDLYAPAPSLSGEILRPLLESGPDIRMHVSNGALASFIESLTLLHPFGKLVGYDLFVTNPEGYRASFRGPGKYDGSVVNWVNGTLLAHAGRRAGFEVHYGPLPHRTGGNTAMIMAEVRDP